MVEMKIAADMLIFDDILTALKKKFAEQDFTNTGSLTYD